MLVIPSLYLKDGQVVKPVLPQEGEPSYELVSDDPVDMAGRWMDRGAKRLHIVDVDGALVGEPVNQEVIKHIAMRFPNFELQVGGGVRSLAAMAEYLKAGVNFIVLSTVAVENSELLEEACEMFPDKIIVCLETLEDKLLSEGRSKSSSSSHIEIIERCKGLGLAAILYSDLSSEIKNHGINLRAMVDVASRSSVPVQLAGGIVLIEDVKAIAAQAFKGIEGVMVGQPLYDGSLDLLEAQHFCDNAHRFA